MEEEIVSPREYVEYIDCLLLEGPAWSNANNRAWELELPELRPPTTESRLYSEISRGELGGELGGWYSNGEKMLGAGPGLSIFSFAIFSSAAFSSALKSTGGPFPFVSLLDRRRRRYRKRPSPMRNEKKAIEPTTAPTKAPVLIGASVDVRPDVGPDVELDVELESDIRKC